MSTIRVDRITPYQSGSVAIEGLSISNLTIDGTLTASLQQGYVWVGNSSGRTTAVSTGSFGGGGADITALNSFTASQQALNTTFADTGSNSFIGNQQISGSLSVSGDDRVASVNPGVVLIHSGSSRATLAPNSVVLIHSESVNNSNIIGFSASPTHFSIPGLANVNEPSIFTADSSSNYYQAIEFQSQGRFAQNKVSFKVPVDVSGSMNISGSTTQVGNQRITGSVNISGSTTQVGDMILTGSLTISGSSTFRNIGPTILSGSVLVSGSINSDGYELAASSTSTIPVLNSTFNLDLSGSASTFIKKTLVLNDGKVLIAGRFESVNGHLTNHIARLNSNGTVDTSFTAPTINASFDPGNRYINNLALQSNGKIIIVGNFYTVGVTGRFGVARLNTDGTEDMTFTNSNGLVDVSLIRDVVIQSDDKIIVVGQMEGGIKRLNSDGSVDYSLDVAIGFSDNSFYSVALLDSGSEQAILVGGNFQQWDTSSDYHHLVKLHPNGTLDLGFAGTNLDIATGNSLDIIQKIKVTDAYSEGDNGYIYIAGRFKDTRTGPNGRNAGFARLTTEDVAFGRGAFDNGFRLYISGSDQYNPGVQYVNDFDFYDDDKILLGGSFTSIGNPLVSYESVKRFIIVDYDNGGLVDGFSDSNYNFNTGSVNSVTLLPNDNVLVGGTFTQVNFGISREGLASLKLTGFGDVTTTTDYSITADTNQLLISSSNTYFSGDITASVISGSFVGDGSGLTGLSTINTGSFAVTGSNTFRGNQSISGSVEISGSLSLTGSATDNFIIRDKPLASTPTGYINTIIGAGAGKDIDAGTGNILLGYQSGYRNTSGDYNIFIGSYSGYYTNGTDQNSFVGHQAGEYNQGADNTSLGYRALRNNSGGIGNVSIGSRSGERTRSGGENGSVSASVFIGNDARPNASSENNQIVIGATAIGNGSNTVVIGNTSITSTTLRGSVSASLFSGSFVGDGSGLTGVGSALPSNILSSSVTNFTDYSQSVDTRISSIVTGTGFATTGSNTFVGNQIVTGSLTLSSSAAVELRVVGDSVLSGSLTVTGSITVPGSGSLVNFVANPSTMRSIRGNGAGLYNIVEQSDGNMTFTVSKIGTRDLTGAITSNISGSTINGSFSDNTTTTSGAGKGARLRGVISGGTVTSLQIETANSSLGYEEEGQPASRQGIGYKAGDTVTINQSLNQVTGSLTITLRQQDIDTYFGVDERISIDYKQYGILTTRTGIISSGSISVGAGVNTLGALNGNNIAAGTDVNVTSDYSIAVGQDLYNDYTNAYANATFGLHHSSSNYAQTIVGIASRLDDTGEGAFVVGNGTTPLIGGGSLTRSNLLVAQGNKVQITGSLDVTGSVTADVYQLGAPATNQENTAYWLYGNFNNAGGMSFGFSSGNAIANIDNVYINETSSDINGAAIVNSIPWINGLETGSVITIQGIDSSPSNLTHTIVLSVNSITDFSGAWGIGVSVVSSTPVAAPVNGSLYSLTYTTSNSGELYTITADESRLLVSSSNTEFNGFVVLSQVSSSYNFANDTAAQAGGVPLGGLYHTSGSVKIRLA
jgi:uncharacterized delta-60 repeat protein